MTQNSCRSHLSQPGSSSPPKTIFMVQLLLADQWRIKPTCAPLQNLLNSLSLSHLHYARAAPTSNSSRHPTCLHLPSLVAQSLAGQWSKNGDERTELLSSISRPGSAKQINKQQKLRSFKLATPPTKSHIYADHTSPFPSTPCHRYQPDLPPSLVSLLRRRLDPQSQYMGQPS
ncbi:unnamed protein product [Prunus armeniaca]|uniref:Uncharacterized protein n=1 Tax=Prunus armeniaca TaxID=36596 RepID=A0A6J5U9T3_PRUAR|nr:unnamed protein product [Prunus armeniaca]